MSYYATATIVMTDGLAEEFFREFPDVKEYMDPIIARKDGETKVLLPYQKWDEDITLFFDNYEKKAEFLYHETDEDNDMISLGARFENGFIPGGVQITFKDPVDAFRKMEAFLAGRIGRDKALEAFEKAFHQSRFEEGMSSVKPARGKNMRM